MRQLTGMESFMLKRHRQRWMQLEEESAMLYAKVLDEMILECESLRDAMALKEVIQMESGVHKHFKLSPMLELGLNMNIRYWRAKDSGEI